MECSVCLRNWNSADCIPKSLSCGHSFCEQCLTSLFAKQKLGITCPMCQNQQKMTANDLKVLPKNYSLLALLRDKMSMVKKSPLPASSLDLSSKGFVPGSNIEAEAHDAERDQIEKIVTAHPFCDKHKMLIHSYVPGTKQILCDKCITELPKTVSNISPIPKVCRDLRQQITRARSIIMLRKSEIKKIKSSLAYVAEASKDETEKTISEYYQKLNEIVSESEKKTRERFKGLCETQQLAVQSQTVNKFLSLVK